LSHLDFDIVSDFELMIKNHPSSACPLPAVHFVPLLLCPFASTEVENVRQIRLFMQNKPNFPHFLPENDDFAKKQSQFKANSNPIKANFGPKIRGAKPIQSQTKPIQTQLLKVRFHKFVFHLTYKGRLLNWVKSWRFATIVLNRPYQYNKPAFLAVRIPYMRDSFNDREEILSCRLIVELS